MSILMDVQVHRLPVNDKHLLNHSTHDINKQFLSEHNNVSTYKYSIHVFKKLFHIHQHLRTFTSLLHVIKIYAVYNSDIKKHFK